MVDEVDYSIQSIRFYVAFSESFMLHFQMNTGHDVNIRPDLSTGLSQEIL